MKVTRKVTGLLPATVFIMSISSIGSNTVFAQYTDEFLNIEFMLPQDEWEKSHFVSADSNTTNFINEFSNSTFFPEAISMVRQVIDNNTSSEDFALLNQELLNTTANLVSFEQRSFTTAQNPAIEQVYTVHIPFAVNSSTIDIPIRTIGIFTSVNDIVYIFAYSAEERFFEEYRPVANNVFQSVTFPLTLGLG